MRFLTTVLRYFMQHKRMSFLFACSILIEVAYMSAAPLSLKYLVDEAFTPKNAHAFVIIMGILLAGGSLNVLSSIVGDYSLGRLSGEVVRKLRGELLAHMQKQSFSFYQRFKSGDLITRFISDVGAMERVIRASFPLFTKETLSVLLGLAMLLVLEWKLTLAMLIGAALVFIAPKLLQNRAETANANYKQAQERFANVIDEMVRGHKTIKSLHQQNRFQQLSRKHIQDLFTFGLRLHMANSFMERLPVIGLLLLNGIMMGFGGYLIFTDQMTVGDFMAFFTLFLAVGQSVSNVSFLLPNLYESNVSFQRVEELMAQNTDVAEAASPLELPAAIREIRMDGVTFGYAREAVQLRDVNLRIEAGSYVAFVGPSGSGKSTALQLLSRFYDPDEGVVAINGVDLRGVSEHSLRKRSTLVTQETFLFDATVRDNLLLDSGATEEEMVTAAKQANIDETIAKWPGGYDTWVHQGGATLSGGERQRLSIARALLRQPELLLLDEVTSALDPASEDEINRLIHAIRGSKTIVSVTHRLASAVGADRIYVFNEGRVVESGTHHELLQLQGLYSSLWEKQHGFHLSPDGQHATIDVGRLAKLPFFAGIESELLHDISALFSTETCSEGQEVVREGEEGNKCYIIVRGKFEIWKAQPDGRQIRVNVLQDGDHFGEIALLRGIPRTATVRALVPSVLLSIRREAFHRLTRDYPHLLAALEHTLKARM